MVKQRPRKQLRAMKADITDIILKHGRREALSVAFSSLIMKGNNKIQLVMPPEIVLLM
jgi:hypothetical protein